MWRVIYNYLLYETVLLPLLLLGFFFAYTQDVSVKIRICTNKEQNCGLQTKQLRQNMIWFLELGVIMGASNYHEPYAYSLLR